MAHLIYFIAISCQELNPPNIASLRKGKAAHSWGVVTSRDIERLAGGEEGAQCIRGV